MKTRETYEKLKKIWIAPVFVYTCLTCWCVVYIRTEMFQVKTIVVTGNQQTGYEEIVKMSGVSIGQNIFKIDRTVIEERLKSIRISMSYQSILNI